MNAIVIDALDHAYAGVPSLHGIALTCPPGAITCLLGPSGCGKSTLLRCIAGHERPTAGRVSLGDRRLVDGRHALPPETRGIGMVFQDAALFPHLRVWENVGFGLRRTRRRERRRLALAALGRFGLEDLAERYPHTCSGGQQQRIALARALAVRPQALLLDEPFSGLDAGLRDDLREDLRRVLHQEAIPTLLVTHDPAEALSCGDRIALMRDGRLVQVGSPDAVWSAPVDAEAMAFFSPVHRLPATVADGCCRSSLGCWPCDATPGHRELVVREAALLVDPAGPIEAEIRDQVVQGADRRVDLRLADGIELRARVRNHGPLPERCRWRVDRDLVRVF